MQDSDGQFLLIEAAHKLPSWLKPETAANRVGSSLVSFCFFFLDLVDIDSSLLVDA